MKRLFVGLLVIALATPAFAAVHQPHGWLSQLIQFVTGYKENKL